jgi:hypothetical protein
MINIALKLASNINNLIDEKKIILFFNIKKN